MRRFSLILLLAILSNSLATFSQSLNELNQSYQNALDSGDKNNAIFYLNKIAINHWDNGNISEAITSFQELYKLAESNGNRNAMRNCCSNLGMIYSDKGNYAKAEEYIQKGLQINRQMGDKAGQAAAYTNLATAQQNQNKNSEALKSAESALAIALEMSNISLIRTCYGLLSDIHRKLGNNEKATEYFNLYASFDQKIKREEMKQVQLESEKKVSEAVSQKRLTEQELQEKHEILKKTQSSLEEAEQLTKEQRYELEIERLKLKDVEDRAKAEIRRQEMIRNFMLIVIVIVVMFSGLLFLQIAKTKRANRLLEQKNVEIQEQKDEIEKQAEKIKASIQYAQRIQAAVLPPQENITKLLSEHFVFFQPRDIVSGDFYWVSEKVGKTIVAVADCTGHGVPGAFMSMLGTAFLNEIISKIAESNMSELHAGNILTELRNYIMDSLHQRNEGSEARDGMDIVLIIIDYKEQKIEYAGANNPLYVVSNGELTVFEPDNMTVSYQRDMADSFKTTTFKFSPDDTLYLCTDGYVDQFGGAHGRKFMVKRFKKMLLEVSKMPMIKQHEVFRKTIDAWRGKRFQVDDMLIMGIKL
ncbi:MAG TPA: SpoIIE family protein phosphatase [Salinivirgaceae bacterium]|nr:SpoIIE family protein phosphatase [Salinivirgaceae bacterium]